MNQRKGSFYVEEEMLTRIVEGLKQDDESAQREFRKIFRGYISRYIYTQIHNGPDVAELTADTMKTVYAKIHNLKSPAALVRWVRTIAHSKVYHFYRDQERKKKKEERDAARKIKKGRFLDIDLTNPDVAKLVEQLPEQQKTAVMLRSRGMKVKEIAEVLDVPEGTIKSRLNYARKAMKKNAYAQND